MMATIAPNFKSLLGQSFGELTVIERASNSKDGTARWRCLCKCGKETTTSTGHLRSGHTQSCGHVGRARASAALRKEVGHAAKMRLFSRYQHGARRFGRGFTLTFEELIDIASSDCHYCGRAPEQLIGREGLNGDFLHNGIDRKDNFGGYSLENSLPCCWPCNKMKRELSYADFTQIIRAIAHHLDL